MDKSRQAQLEARARVLKAMAHPSRLLILEELAKRERCVCELTEMIGADMSTVSKHLTYLQTMGLVSGEKRGAQVFYSLKVPCVLKFMHCIESVLKANAETQMACLR